jgi:hypothetical protein
VDTSRLRVEHASGVEADDDQLFDDELPEPERYAARAASEATRSGGEPGAVGYRRLTVTLRREGWPVNAKRIYRLHTGRTCSADQGAQEDRAA